MLLPLRKLVVPDALPHAFTLIPLSHLRDATSAGTMRLVVALAVVAAAALFALVPRRALVVLPALLFVALAAGSVSASREVADQARAQQQRLLGPGAALGGRRRRRADGVRLRRPGLLERGLGEPVLEPPHPLRSTTCPGTQVPGPAAADDRSTSRPRRRAAARTAPSRRRRSRSCRCTSRCAARRSPRRARSAPTGSGLGLWRLDRPLRLDTITSGLFENGDVDREATLTAYDCRAGTFDARPAREGSRRP